MKNFRKACRGEKGFTLIELLVVIVILGVLAAVVTLAVTRFIGKGKVEAANAEVATVQAAVEAALGEANSAAFNAGTFGLAWSGGTTNCPAAGTDNVTVDEFLRQHNLKAAYTIDVDGDITAADATIAGGWGTDMTFTAATQKWTKS